MHLSQRSKSKSRGDGFGRDPLVKEFCSWRRSLFSLNCSSCGSFDWWESLQPERRLDFRLDGENNGLLGIERGLWRFWPQEVVVVHFLFRGFRAHDWGWRMKEKSKRALAAAKEKCGNPRFLLIPYYNHWAKRLNKKIKSQRKWKYYFPHSISVICPIYIRTDTIFIQGEFHLQPPSYTWHCNTPNLIN